MYWKIDQRLPIDAPQGSSTLQAKPRPSGNASAFASILADRMNTGSLASTDMREPLSSEFVQWLATIAHARAESAPATTLDWMSATRAIAAPATGAKAAETPIGVATGSMPAPISRLIQQAASRYHLDPALISSVIAQESSFDPQAVSPAGAQGLMQLMPDTAHELHVTDTFDPAQNIDGGSRYLAGLIQRYHGDVKLALAAYNWGMGNLERQPHKLPAETRHYVASIMQRWQASGGDRLA